MGAIVALNGWDTVVKDSKVAAALEGMETRLALWSKAQKEALMTSVMGTVRKDDMSLLALTLNLWKTEIHKSQIEEMKLRELQQKQKGKDSAQKMIMAKWNGQNDQLMAAVLTGLLAVVKEARLHTKLQDQALASAAKFAATSGTGFLVIIMKEWGGMTSGAKLKE